LSEINYIVKMTQEITNDDVEKFLNLFNFVFDEIKDNLWFNWKYKQNIYGDSIHVFAYDEDKLVGIRCFWRNDLIKQIAYQPCDTAVLSEYRNRGIFSSMSRFALEKSKGAFIYNFPNENSLPANLKMGWKIYKNRYLGLNLRLDDLNNEEDYIDEEYLKWRYVENPNNKYYYTSGREKSYLLLKRKNGIYFYLGNFEPKFNQYFEKTSGGLIFRYLDKKTLTSSILKSKSTTVYYDNRETETVIPFIPINKADYF